MTDADALCQSGKHSWPQACIAMLSHSRIESLLHEQQPRLNGCHEWSLTLTMGSQIMLNIKRGQHGSTYGGNPVAAKVAVAALKVLVEEQLAQNSERMGKLLRSQLQAIPSRRIAEVGTSQHRS